MFVVKVEHVRNFEIHVPKQMNLTFIFSLGTQPREPLFYPALIPLITELVLLQLHVIYSNIFGLKCGEFLVKNKIVFLIFLFLILLACVHPPFPLFGCTQAIILHL